LHTCSLSASSQATNNLLFCHVAHRLSPSSGLSRV
jgi:hypothetical protein